ncbi:MAG: glycosyl transferase [Sphingobacteriales bacterium]|nr:glycosyl transferase [Sphingobacteriales bacterium]
MKVLYAIQATGNGHISRAREIVPLLQQKCELDILISGTQADVDLPFAVKFRFKGISLIYNNKGALSLLKTAGQLKLKQIKKEIAQLPVEEYDLVINDFEPISAWACKMKKIPCISLSHQAAVANKFSPKPRVKDLAGELVLRYFAPCQEKFGFHFQQYDENIFSPVIRSQIRNATIQNGNHYTVYLPSYHHTYLLKQLSRYKNAYWHIFTRDIKEALKIGNCYICPIQNENFIESMAGSKGVLCGAGFEGPAEALYLKKKLMVIPIAGQYEQHCNAEALKRMGIPVIKHLSKKYHVFIQNWINEESHIKIDFPDITESIIDLIIEKYLFVKSNFPGIIRNIYTTKKAS